MRSVAGLILLLGLCVMLFNELIAPRIISFWMNERTREMPDIVLSYEKIETNIFQGTFSVHNFKIRKTITGSPPIVDAKRLDVQLTCGTGDHSRLMTSVQVHHPKFACEYDGSAIKGQAQFLEGLIRYFTSWLTIPINEVNILGGKFTYHALNQNRRICITEIDLSLRHLQRNRDETYLLPSVITGSASFETARLSIQVRFDGQQSVHDFDLQAKILNVALASATTHLGFPRYQGQENQSFSLFTQITSERDRLIGFVSPRLENVFVVSYDRPDDNGSFDKRMNEFGRPFRQIAFEATTDPGNYVLSERIYHALYRALKEGIEPLIKEVWLSENRDPSHRYFKGGGVLKRRELRSS